MTKNKLTWYVHGASRIAHFEHTRKLPEGWVSDLSGTKADSTKPKMGPTPAFVAPPMIFYNYDHLGNTRLTYSATVKLGDETATITYTAETLHDYDPYGKILRSFVRLGSSEKYLTTGHERDTETDLDYRGARFYDSDVVRFLSLDPLAAKYAAWSAYNYVLGNPIVFVDKDGKEPTDIIFLIYTQGNVEGGDAMFKKAAETRKADIETSKGFDKNRDIVIMLEVNDLGKLKKTVENEIANNKDKYGETREVDIYSHAGHDGPKGSELNSNKETSLDKKQMSIAGWSAVDWNWSKDANDYKSFTSLGCMTATSTGGNFSETLSTQPNMKDITVRGQVTSAYPSLYSDSYSSNAAISKEQYKDVSKVYMVGRGQKFQSIFGSSKLNAHKNGSNLGGIWQDGRRTPKE